jgi:hypothetical protein
VSASPGVSCATWTAAVRPVPSESYKQGSGSRVVDDPV